MVSADVNFASGTLLVEYEPAADPRERVAGVVRSTGHGLQPLEGAAAGVEGPQRRWIDRNLTELATAGSGVFTALGMALGWGGAHAASIAAYVLAIVFGGLLVWRRVLLSLRARILDMNVLMTIAVFGAAALGEWGEGATVYFLFALGGLLEARSLERTRRSIRDLMDLAPPTARVLRDGEFVELAVGEVMVGDTVLVRPGERVPVDGVVAVGATAVDESPVTGESVPVEKGLGDEVFAGTLNASGLVEVRASAAAGDSTLARIVYLVEEAQASRAPAQTFIERFTRYYTPSVIALAVAIGLVVPAVALAFGFDWGPWGEWVRRALVMLVVSCPCALVISTPVSIVSGITRAGHDGVLVKGGAFIETAAKVSAIAFDKTGTLTRGKPEVVDVTALGAVSTDDLLALAAALESHSNHPLARAIVHAAGGLVHPGAFSDVAEVPGRGVSGLLDGVRYEVCSPAQAEESGAWSGEVAEAASASESAGRTALVVVRDGAPFGVIAVADALRAETPSVIAALRGQGIEHAVMLTGDNERVAEGVAGMAGLNGFLARLLPEDKTRAVGALKERYGIVAMVGDGVNDAPALAASDLGIAMGAAGSDTALETADVALMRDDLTALPGFLSLARATMRTIVVNVTFSIAVKALVLVLALIGSATLWMAVFADTGVALLVILNGMRLLRAPGGRSSRARFAH